MAKRKGMNPAWVQEAVLCLVGGLAEEAVLAKVVKAGAPPDDAGLVLKEARALVQITADYNRDEQLGLAIRRLNRLIELNVETHDDFSKPDHAVALRAQVELNKLLRLHEVNAGATGEAEEGDGAGRADEVSKTRAHLSPLFEDLPADYPLSELARMAAEKLRMGDGGDDQAA